MPIRLLAFLGCLFCLLGCGQTGPFQPNQNKLGFTPEDETGFLTVEDLKPQKDLSDLTEEDDLADAITELEWEFPLFGEVDEDPDDAFTKCFRKLLAKEKLYADKNKVQFSVEFVANKATCDDLDGDLNKDSDAKISIEEIKLKLSLFRTCDNSDLSSLNGRSLGDAKISADLAKLCKEAKTQTDLSNSVSELSYKITADEFAYEAKTKDTSGVVTPEAKPCVWLKKAEEWTAETCLTFNKSEVVSFKITKGEIDEDDVRPDSTYSKGLYRSLAGKIDNKYFQSGVSQIVVNDWSGVAEVDGTAKINWQLQRDGKKISGKTDLEEEDDDDDKAEDDENEAI